MALNITPTTLLSNSSVVLDFLTKSLNLDIIAVLDQGSMTQVFRDARPVKARVIETATVMKYPVETGAMISDHRISNPTQIEFICIMPASAYSSAYPAIRNAWQSATLLSVQTRTGTYRNMIISDMPHEEEPDMFNAITQFIKFEEVIFVAPSSIAKLGPLVNFAPANPAYSSTVNSGLLAPITATSAAMSYFHAGTVWGVPI